MMGYTKLILREPSRFYNAQRDNCSSLRVFLNGAEVSGVVSCKTGRRGWVRRFASWPVRSNTDAALIYVRGVVDAVDERFVAPDEAR